MWRAVCGGIEKYGGRYLVYRAAIEVLEGGCKPRRLTVIEFPTTARAKEFHDSREFREIVDFRLRSATTNLVLVEGGQGPVGPWAGVAPRRSRA